ncbi:RHS repeat-associated core domain-containing protein, partial [Endozoicomonas sp. ALB115]|uniref:RHS repeat-associated core domain-containing protein n=1 Tax=Endozoicomonas sp. ALB115 TaxID=3403074 RepID=UPI003BB62AEE
ATNLSPYGVADITRGESLGFNIRFPGQYADSESGLYYNRFRDYAPGNGRYVQSDPIGLLGGLNGFSYVTASPNTQVDPYGLTGVIGSALPPPPPTTYLGNIQVEGPYVSPRTPVEQLFNVGASKVVETVTSSALKVSPKSGNIIPNPIGVFVGTLTYTGGLGCQTLDCDNDGDGYPDLEYANMCPSGVE